VWGEVGGEVGRGRLQVHHSQTSLSFEVIKVLFKNLIFKIYLYYLFIYFYLLFFTGGYIVTFTKYITIYHS
jgi:hypothetical protein